MAYDNYKQLLSELGQLVGLPELEPDKDNYCCLGFDDKVILHMQYSPETQIAMVFTQIGKLKEGREEYLYPKLLKANLFWQGTGGATIGVDDETREILLCYQVQVERLEFSQFQELIEGFVNTAELWINTLEAVQNAPESQGGGDSKPPSMPSGPAPGMRA